MGRYHNLDGDPAVEAGRREERQRQDGYAKSSRISELEAEVERLQGRDRLLGNSLSFMTDALDPALSEETADWEITDVRWRLRIDGLHAKIKRLQGIVDKLPKAKDGVSVVPKLDDLWHPTELVSGILQDDWEVEFDRTGDGCWHYHPITECYSTREAAEAGGE